MKPFNTPKQTAKEDAANDSYAQELSAVERIFGPRGIHARLHAEEYPNIEKLCEDFCVHRATILRDIAFMRDRWDLPVGVGMKKGRKGYYYTEPVEAFPLLKTSEGEFIALLLSKGVMPLLRGTGFDQSLHSVSRKLAKALPDTIAVDLVGWQQIFSFFSNVKRLFNPETFFFVARAAMERAQLRMKYQKPGEKVKERVINPYHMLQVKDHWLVLAVDVARKVRRKFVPARIKSVEKTGVTFPPVKFSVEEELRGSYGFYAGDGDYLVIIRYNPRAAHYIREVEHKDQIKLVELPDGSVEQHLRLTGLFEIEHEVLDWGGQAVVIEPRELQENVLAATKKLTCEQEKVMAAQRANR